MATCKLKSCGRTHTNGSNFCSRQCRLKKIELNKPKWAKMKKKIENGSYLLEQGFTGRGSNGVVTD